MRKIPHGENPGEQIVGVTEVVLVIDHTVIKCVVQTSCLTESNQGQRVGTWVWMR